MICVELVGFGWVRVDKVRSGKNRLEFVGFGLFWFGLVCSGLLSSG